MILSTSRMIVRPESRSGFLETMRGLLEPARIERGCLTYRLYEVARATKELIQELGHDPLPEDIAARLNIPLPKVQTILTTSKEPVSLDTPIGQASSPLDIAINNDLKNKIERVLCTLHPKEEKILRMRFGIGDYDARTLQELGQEFDLTRERIRQIEVDAIRKLKHNSRSLCLRTFLDT